MYLPWMVLGFIMGLFWMLLPFALVGLLVYAVAYMAFGARRSQERARIVQPYSGPDPTDELARVNDEMKAVADETRSAADGAREAVRKGVKG